MTNPILAQLTAEIEETKTVQASAVALITGFSARIQAAVDAVLANGASEADLAPIQTELDALTESSNALAAAVTANTPAA